ncbi:hypothetical protein J8C01_11620 [Chloracidobacterium sp. D]|uniref:hypothetical protein n=1 Tax=Chloracidobacterium sp. D TaxID=2821536 RepID=UPI001B8C2D3C|nr:hypothetical protein [Chloracidobacterium sp. D]QUV83326.1 hypothetical protein J8C01_11620 [Chloracidobacterium sp. D]
MSQQRLPNMSDGKTSSNAAGSSAEGDIVKIDNVLVCTNNNTIVIESKSKPIGWLAFLLFFLLLIPAWFTDLLLIMIYPLLFIMIYPLASKLASDVIDRKIIDKKKMIIRFEKEKKGKLKTKAQYSTSVVKNVKVVVDDYSRIYLDFYPGSVTESVYIIGEEVWDNAKKLELAHKIAEFLGVPVIEKT